MKKLFLFLTLLIAGITANAQYSPSNNLNYVKLLKVPPVGAVEDSVLVYDGSDSFVKMRPSSVLIGKATATKTGTIKTDITESDPVVYTKTTSDDLLELKANKDSGLLSGGVISINSDPTKWDLAAGEGYITNSLTGVVTPVSWSTQLALTTPYLASSVATYVLINSSGSVVMQNSAPAQQQYRTHIYLGKLAHTTFTTILFAVSEPSRMFDVAGQVSDLNRFLGSGNVDGNVISANGANLNINASAGMTYRAGANYSTDRDSPSITTEPIFTAGTFRNKFRNGSGGWSAVNTSVIDPNNYDNGSGILQVVPNNKWTVKALWRFGGTGTIHCDYGQVVYDNKVDALAAAGKAAVAEDPETKRDASRRAWLVVQQGTTVLNDLTKAEFIPADKLGERSSGSSSTATFQTTYNNSVTPQITTSVGGGALAIKQGSGSDTDNILVGQNGAGTNTFSVTGDGNITGGTYNGYTPESNSNKATSFSTVNNTLYPTVQAVKTYADGLVVGLLNDRGSYDASSNLFPSTGGSGTAGAILKGNLWAVSLAGTLGGVSVGIGDWIRALTDTPGQTASNWSVVEGNFGYVPANDNNVVHLAGTENITGDKTVSGILTSTGGIILNSGLHGSSVGAVLARSGDHLFLNSRNASFGALLNTSSIATTDKTFTFPNASGTFALTSDLTNFVSGSLTSGYIPKATGANSLGNSVTQDFGYYLQHNFTGGGSLGGLNYGVDNIGAFYNSLGNYGHRWLTNSGSIEAMSITSGGNFLIGTTTDDGVNKLQVNGSITATNYTGGATLSAGSTAPTPTTSTGIANKDYVDSAVSSASFLASEFTPTISSTSNISSYSVGGASYLKAGDIVTVSCGMLITPTATGGVSFRIALPFAKTTTNSINIGNGTASNGGASVYVPMIGSTLAGSTSECIFSFTTTSTSQHGVNIRFQYSVNQ